MQTPAHLNQFWLLQILNMVIHEVNKEGCISHVQNRLGTALHSYKNKRQGAVLSNGTGGKGRLTDQIDCMQTAYGYFFLFFIIFFFMHFFFSGTKHPREDNPNLYYWAEITGLHTQTFNI